MPPLSHPRATSPPTSPPSPSFSTCANTQDKKKKKKTTVAPPPRTRFFCLLFGQVRFLTLTFARTLPLAPRVTLTLGALPGPTPTLTLGALPGLGRRRGAQQPAHPRRAGRRPGRRGRGPGHGGAALRGAGHGGSPRALPTRLGFRPRLVAQGRARLRRCPTPSPSPRWWHHHHHRRHHHHQHHHHNTTTATATSPRHLMAPPPPPPPPQGLLLTVAVGAVFSSLAKFSLGRKLLLAYPSFFRQERPLSLLLPHALPCRVYHSHSVLFLPGAFFIFFSIIQTGRGGDESALVVDP